MNAFTPMVSEKLHLKKEDFEIPIAGYKLRARRISYDTSSLRPVLVFLHEALGCIEMWREFPERIGGLTGCDVLVYDRRGYGKSSPLPSSSITTQYLHLESWESLPAILSHCRIGHGIFIGHSDGGTIALLFASKFPDMVDGVVTEAAHVFVENHTLKGVRNAAHAFNSSNLREKLLKYHGLNVDRMFWRWAKTWSSGEFADWNMEDNLKTIKAPVLAIQGACDEYGTINQLKSIVRNVAGYSEKLVIPGCGHIPHFQAHDLVTREMSRFISEHCL